MFCSDRCVSSKVQAPCAPNRGRELHQSAGPDDRPEPPRRDRRNKRTGLVCKSPIAAINLSPGAFPTMIVDANVPSDSGLPFGTKKYWPALMSATVAGTSVTILTFAGMVSLFSPYVYLIVRTSASLSKTEPSVYLRIFFSLPITVLAVTLGSCLGSSGKT